MEEPTEVAKVLNNIEALEEEMADHTAAIMGLIAKGESTREEETVVERTRFRIDELRRYLAKLTEATPGA